MFCDVPNECSDVDQDQDYPRLGQSIQTVFIPRYDDVLLLFCRCNQRKRDVYVSRRSLLPDPVTRLFVSIIEYNVHRPTCFCLAEMQCLLHEKYDARWSSRSVIVICRDIK